MAGIRYYSKVLERWSLQRLHLDEPRISLLQQVKGAGKKLLSAPSGDGRTEGIKSLLQLWKSPLCPVLVPSPPMTSDKKEGNSQVGKSHLGLGQQDGTKPCGIVGNRSFFCKGWEVTSGPPLLRPLFR